LTVTEQSKIFDKLYERLEGYDFNLLPKDYQFSMNPVYWLMIVRNKISLV